MRYAAAISDADILINLASVNRLDVLELLFKEIIILQYVYEKEIKGNAGRYYTTINKAICKEESIFKIVDRKEDKYLNYLARVIIKDKIEVIGPGESECAGYAYAMRIPIIISDNYTEFKWLEEFITLTHNNILALCVYFGKLGKSEAEDIFNKINENLPRPTGDTFDDQYRKAFMRFEKMDWKKYLGI
ncbi:MAG TPA: hypothetical protein GXZ20_06165 [Halanaerobiaceae bacterium]|jgi:predicted nucleic acid-binding protein|nr:hypothetical protein [Halanaerobiaceae bacterium]